MEALTFNSMRSCNRKGSSPQGLRVGSHQHSKMVSEETHADKATDFIRKERPGGGQKVKGPPEDCSASWLTVSRFIVVG